MAGFGAAAGLGLLGVAVHNATRVARLRRDGPAEGGERTHDAVVGEGLGEELRVLILGDSAADGFGITDAQLAFPRQVAVRLAAATGRRVRVASVAENGATTATLTRDQLPVLRRRGGDVDVVVLSVGVNDAVARHAPRQVRTETGALLDAARAAVPDADLVLVTCPDLGTAPRIPRPLRDLLGWSCRRVARAQLRAARDAGVAVAEIDGRVDASMYGVDGFHPGPLGQAGMADLVVAALFDHAPT